MKNDVHEGVVCLAMVALTEKIVDGVDMCIVLYPFILGVVLVN